MSCRDSREKSTAQCSGPICVFQWPTELPRRQSAQRRRHHTTPAGPPRGSRLVLSPSVSFRWASGEADRFYEGRRSECMETYNVDSLENGQIRASSVRVRSRGSRPGVYPPVGGNEHRCRTTIGGESQEASGGLPGLDWYVLLEIEFTRRLNVEADNRAAPLNARSLENRARF